MPKSLTANSGFDALTHAIESYVSVYATEFTFGYSREAIEKLFKYLPSAYKNGKEDEIARDHVHIASTIAGIAFGNAVIILILFQVVYFMKFKSFIIKSFLVFAIQWLINLEVSLILHMVHVTQCFFRI